MNNNTLKRIWQSCCFPLLFLNLSCGSSGGSGGGKGQPGKNLELAFQEASRTSGVPVRMIKAAAFLESGMSSSYQTTPYFDSETEASQKLLGFSTTETAFGITRKDLGLSENPDADLLTVQVKAYGDWVKSHISNSTELKLSPQTTDDKYYWVWELAKIHRAGDEYRRNIRVVWAKELIAMLNTGSHWIGSDGDKIELAPESPPIKTEDLPLEGQRWLSLNFDTAEILNASRFELTNTNIPSIKNNPDHLTVIHCPLSLSACLESQNNPSATGVTLGAHYVIPQNGDVFPRALQLVPHDRIVVMSDRNGKSAQISDSIVIMMVGISGSYVDGYRNQADPRWMTPWQLRRLSAVVSGVCNSLHERDPNIQTPKCQTIGGQGGVNFFTQGNRAYYRWGDVPDYDDSLISSYLKSRDANLESEVVFNFPSKNKSFQANQDFPFSVQFPTGTYYVWLQRSVRCPNGQIVWDKIQNATTKGTTSFSFSSRFIDSGPNNNGEQFLRLVAFDETNQLVAWETDEVQINNFESDYSPPADACF